MKQIKDLNRKEKVQLLELIKKGVVEGDSITKETYVLESASDYHILINIVANNKDAELSYTALDENVLSEISKIENDFEKIVENRKDTYVK